MMKQGPYTSPWRKTDAPPAIPGRWLLAALVLVLLLASGCTAARLNTPALRATNAEQDMAFVGKLPRALEGALTLQQAISYALAHNVETQLAEMQRAIQEEALTGKKMQMLPSLMAEYEVTGRSKSVPMRAEDPDTGATTLSPSITSDRTTQDVKVTLAWNVLDFGVTYFKARQSLNRISIMEEQIRRAKQRLVLDVTRAYGEALAASEAAELAKSLLSGHDQRLRAIRLAGFTAPDQRRAGLKSEILTLESMNELARHENEAKAARAKLAQLLGLAPGSELTLVRLDTARLPAPIEEDMRTLEKEAILNRAELSEKDIQEHITADDARIALARLFPSPAVFLGFERNSNSFLSVNSWFSVGMNVSWNLFAIPQNLSDRKRSELGQEAVRMERMALATAILAQLHISVLGYDEAVRQFLAREDVASRRQAYAREMEEALSQGKAGPDEVLRERKAAFQARVERTRAYAALLAEREMVFNTLGRDPALDRGYAALQPQATALAAATPKPAPRVAAVSAATPAPASAAAPSTALAATSAVTAPAASVKSPAMATAQPQPPAQPAQAAVPAAVLASAPAMVAAPVPAATVEPVPSPAQAPAQAVVQAAQHPAQYPARPALAPPPQPDIRPAVALAPPVLASAALAPSQGMAQNAAPAQRTSTAKPAAPGVTYSEQDGRGVLTVTGLPAGQSPAWFHLDGPDRLVIDIPGIRHDGPGKVASSDPNVRQVRIGEHPGKVRVVLDLRGPRAVTPTILPSPGGAVIFLGNPGGMQASSPAGGPA